MRDMLVFAPALAKGLSARHPSAR